MVEESSDKRSISSIVGFVIAIVGLVLSPVPIVNNFAFVLAIISLIFGFVAISATKNQKKKGRKLAIATLIISVLAGGIVLTSQAFYSDSLDKAGKEIQTSVDNSSGKNTNNLLGKSVNVDIGAFQAATDQYGLVTSSLPVKVTNKESSQKSYSIQIEAVGAAGTRITDDTVMVNNLGGDQSQDLKAFQYVDPSKVEELKTAKFKVASVSQY